MSEQNENNIMLSPEHVAEYLEQHPDFFQNRDQLLQKMSIRQDDSSAISLVERQVRVLREKNLRSRLKLNELFEIAEKNNATFEKCRTLLLGLLASNDRDTFFNEIENCLTMDFDCSAYSLILFDSKPEEINHCTIVVTEDSAQEHIGALMRSKKPTLGSLRPAEQDYLFRQDSIKVRSAAVLTIRTDKLIALLAIGSNKLDYFKPSHGTVFIDFLADILALLMPKHLKP